MRSKTALALPGGWIMTWSTWGRWTVRSLRVAALTGGLALGTSAAFAQFPAAPPSSVAAATKKTFTKNTAFNLPIQMDERVRASLREVQLHVKTGVGDWVRQETVSPQTQFFTYRAPQDGEYWFALVTVDRLGKAVPADINAEPPKLRVVVDTRAPVLETTMGMEGNEPVLRVNIADANPDPQSVRAFVVTEQGERALTPLQGQTGQAAFRLSPSDLNAPIRVMASDLCGNLATKDISGRDLVGAGAPIRNDQVVQVSNPAPLQTLPPAYNPPPVPPMYAPPLQTTSNISNTSYRPPVDSGDRPANRKIINTTHASIDYRIDTVGQSGVGRVDIWMTPDRGQRWDKIAEDHDKHTPAEIDLPGDGLFGIRLAITNGNGFGGRAPKSGDRPSFFIEVDTLSPNLQMQPVEIVPGSGAVNIRWTCADPNLGPEPIGIYFRTRTDAAWQPIARNLRNDGAYQWAFPKDLGGDFFLKMEAVDLAGNVTKVETPLKVDIIEPEATLLDVTGLPNRGQSLTPTPLPPSQPMIAPGRNP
jgi:hypothetical protein